MGRFKSAAEGDTPTVVQAEQVAASTMDKTGAKYLRAPECILGRALQVPEAMRVRYQTWEAPSSDRVKAHQHQ